MAEPFPGEGTQVRWVGVGWGVSLAGRCPPELGEQSLPPSSPLPSEMEGVSCLLPGRGACDSPKSDCRVGTPGHPATLLFVRPETLPELWARRLRSCAGLPSLLRLSPITVSFRTGAS